MLFRSPPLFPVNAWNAGLIDVRDVSLIRNVNREEYHDPFVTDIVESHRWALIKPHGGLVTIISGYDLLSIGAII